MLELPDVRAPVSRRSFLTIASMVTIAAACGDDGSKPLTDATRSTVGPGVTGTTPASLSVPQEAPRFVSTGPGTRPEVALTFHTDGELELAARILEILAEARAPMTAFVVGEWLDANPAWGPRLVDAGHELANHTYSHPDFDALTQQAMSEEVVGGRDALLRSTGQPGTFFRPSGTADGTAPVPETVLDVASAAGYPIVLGFDVDPFDYQDPGASAVVERTLGAVRAGSIVSLHFGHVGTADALPAILDGLAERSLLPVTASALLAPDTP
jgi:peptidoglycan/xylan/chitin deacetylase (PgdA/CDA1 family)